MVINEVISALRREGGDRIRTAISGDQRLQAEELATATDPGLFGPASVAWRVHGETSMLIGGLRALLLQTLHPLAMAGVAEHSDYRHDPWGRLHRTGHFIGATTFGSTESAERVIAKVRRVHEHVNGVAPDGRPYSATDPHLLGWVHATEVDSFLGAYDRYGVGKLTDDERDRYVAEMAGVAHRLGAEAVPTTALDLAACLEGYRLECVSTDQTREALKFLLNPPVALAMRPVYGVISAGAVGLLPDWAARMLRLQLPPGFDPLAIRLPAAAVTRTIGWMMTAERNLDLDDRLLSTPT